MVYLLLFMAVIIVLLLLRAESMNGISSVKTEKEKSRDNYRNERSYSYREEYSYDKSVDNEASPDILADA